MRRRNSIERKLRKMIETKVFIGMKWEALSSWEKGKAIRSSMLLKERYLSTAGFDKLTAHLLVGGNMHLLSLRNLFASGVVAFPLFFAVLAGKEMRHVRPRTWEVLTSMQRWRGQCT